MFFSIESELRELLKSVGIEDNGDFATPPRPEMGDVAFPCFVIAKNRGKNPALAAKEIAFQIEKQLDTESVIEKVAAFGPYVNFYLKASAIVASVIAEVADQKEKFGCPSLRLTTSPGAVMIEYPSNNTHKEFHIGHFRNVCIGNTLVQLYRKSGYDVYPINYLNDFGAHVARCLWGLQKFHANEQPPENKQKWLGQIYAESSRYLKEHPDDATEVGEVQKKLEAKDQSIWPLFEKTRQWSIERFDEIFKELGVKHAAVFYEKDIKAEGQKIVDELLNKGIATVGEGGAIIIDLSGHGLDVALVRKSNGTGLYLTSDLPLARKKFEKFDVDESIVITSEEQKFYFRQLHKILELMGFQKKLTHLVYGLVNLPEGKMSSRTGNVILYEDLRDQVLETILSETKARHADWASEKINTTAHTIALAALKFDMQKHESGKNVVFDVKEATSVEGFSGPYILYAIARINSIEEKAKKENIFARNIFSGLVSAEEKKLALLMGEAEDTIQKALAEYNPSVIARYAFDLAQAFNDFYNKHSIINAQTGELAAGRLALVLAVRQVLRNMLGVLTIEAVEEM